MGGWAKTCGCSGLAVGVVAGMTLLAGVAAAQTPSLTLIGTPPGRLDSLITGMSSDGTVFAGYTQPVGGRRGFTWTRAGGFDEWGASPNVPSETRGLAISGDGSTVVGRRDFGTQGVEAFRYRNGTYSTLGALPSGYDQSTASGVNANGSVIVGAMYDSRFVNTPGAMRWTAATGMQNIGVASPGHVGAEFTGLSRDGSTAIGISNPGFNGGRAYSWTESGGWRFLPMPDGFGAVYDARPVQANFDGSIIVGYSSNFSAPGATSAGILWQYGMPRDLGTFGQDWSMFPQAVSDNGSVIVGGARNVETRRDVAVIWLNGGGPVNFQDYLASLGVGVPSGWQIAACGSVSADGNTVSGVATDGQRLQGFIATIPTPAAFAPLAMTFLIASRRRRSIA